MPGFNDPNSDREATTTFQGVSGKIPLVDAETAARERMREEERIFDQRVRKIVREEIERLLPKDLSRILRVMEALAKADTAPPPPPKGFSLRSGKVPHA